MNAPHLQTRRDFLTHSGSGLGAVALAALLTEEGRGAVFEKKTVIDPLDPLASRKPHFAPTARNIIFLFQSGGPPQTDTFDYKPILHKLHGQPVPDSIKKIKDRVGGVLRHCKDELMSGPWEWQQRGQSGLRVSSLLPSIGAHADDLCVIRSMYCDSSNHAPATYQMNTGVTLGNKPSVGSWLTYGLGSANRNLPGYMVLFQVGGFGGTANWSNAFLPSAFQGTRFRHEGEPFFNLRPPAELAGTQRRTLDLIQTFNRTHRDARPDILDLDGRIASYEMAYRMQTEALEVSRVENEPAHIQKLYGIEGENKAKAQFGRMCLQARRMVEAGVRVVQVYQMVDKLGWDGHGKNTEFAERNAVQTDQATGALLTDLKQRGLLDSTLVVWAGEFGRTPMMQGDRGRNHNPYGFTVWLSGGGVRGGQVIGATDDIGLRAEVDRHHVGDLHATMLHAMGMRPDDLFFEHDGRPERLTGVAGSRSPILQALR